MKKLILLVFVSINILSTLSWAGQKGNGGDGIALLFTEMARRIHRESLMAPYDQSKIQMRDEIPMDAFYVATVLTKVISTSEKVLDNHSDVVTAAYRSPEDLRAKWSAQNVSEENIATRLEEFPYGLIEVNRERFKEELQMGWGIAFKTVFHEIVRVMGLKEQNYRFAADLDATAFFQSLYNQSSPVTKVILSQAIDQPRVLSSKFDLIDREQARLRLIMAEDNEDLKKQIRERAPIVEQQKKAFAAYGKAFAKSLGDTGMIPMPFGSYREKVFKGMVKTISEGLTYEQKLTEAQVLNEQIAFLNSKQRANLDHYLKLDEKRRALILTELE